MRTSALVLLGVVVVGCGGDPVGQDPATAERAPIDRFSAAAGTMLNRTLRPGLPGPDVFVDFDQPPFLVRGLGPAGEHVSWYDWDARPRAPVPIYQFYAGGRIVKDQLNVVDVIPGDPGYNDLWQVVRVEVPRDYVANTVTSLEGIRAEGFVLTTTDELVNCPVVPRASVARKRLAGDYSDLHQGWYQDKLIHYFHFGEKRLVPDGGQAPTSPVYGAFAINPGQPGGGPAAGWKDDGAGRTHDVLATLPADAAYSPFRPVRVYDVAAFATVTDLASAMAAPAIATPTELLVNWPVVELPAP